MYIISILKSDCRCQQEHENIIQNLQKFSTDSVIGFTLLLAEFFMNLTVSMNATMNITVSMNATMNITVNMNAAMHIIVSMNAAMNITVSMNDAMNIVRGAINLRLR